MSKIQSPDKNKATSNLLSVGSSATRNKTGSFNSNANRRVLKPRASPIRYKTPREMEREVQACKRKLR